MDQVMVQSHSICQTSDTLFDKQVTIFLVTMTSCVPPKSMPKPTNTELKILHYCMMMLFSGKYSKTSIINKMIELLGKDVLVNKFGVCPEYLHDKETNDGERAPHHCDYHDNIFDYLFPKEFRGGKEVRRGIRIPCPRPPLSPPATAAKKRSQAADEIRFRNMAEMTIIPTIKLEKSESGTWHRPEDNSGEQDLGTLVIGETQSDPDDPPEIDIFNIQDNEPTTTTATQVIEIDVPVVNISNSDIQPQKPQKEYNLRSALSSDNSEDELQPTNTNTVATGTRDLMISNVRSSGPVRDVNQPCSSSSYTGPAPDREMSLPGSCNKSVNVSGKTITNKSSGDENVDISAMVRGDGQSSLHPGVSDTVSIIHTPCQTSSSVPVINTSSSTSDAFQLPEPVPIMVRNMPTLSQEPVTQAPPVSVIANSTLVSVVVTPQATVATAATVATPVQSTSYSLRSGQSAREQLYQSRHLDNYYLAMGDAKRSKLINTMALGNGPLESSSRSVNVLKSECGYSHGALITHSQNNTSVISNCDTDAGLVDRTGSNPASVGDTRHANYHDTWVSIVPSSPLHFYLIETLKDKQQNIYQVSYLCYLVVEDMMSRGQYCANNKQILIPGSQLIGVLGVPILHISMVQKQLYPMIQTADNRILSVIGLTNTLGIYSYSHLYIPDEVKQLNVRIEEIARRELVKECLLTSDRLELPLGQLLMVIEDFVKRHSLNCTPMIGNLSGTTIGQAYNISYVYISQSPGVVARICKEVVEDFDVDLVKSILFEYLPEINVKNEVGKIKNLKADNCCDQRLSNSLLVYHLANTDKAKPVHPRSNEFARCHAGWSTATLSKKFLAMDIGGQIIKETSSQQVTLKKYNVSPAAGYNGGLFPPIVNVDGRRRIAPRKS